MNCEIRKKTRKKWSENEERYACWWHPFYEFMQKSKQYATQFRILHNFKNDTHETSISKSSDFTWTTKISYMILPSGMKLLTSTIHITRTTLHSQIYIHHVFLYGRWVSLTDEEKIWCVCVCVCVHCAVISSKNICIKQLWVR